jgi:hypothetical protein
MKTIAFSAAIALLGAAFTIAAHAQTGAPSAQEVGRQASVAQSAPIDAADAEVGSYARYLMLNGKTRDEAILEARNVDHASATRTFAWHRAPKQAAGAATTQQ